MYDIVMKDLHKQYYYSLNYCLSKAQVLLWSIYNLTSLLLLLLLLLLLFAAPGFPTIVVVVVVVSLLLLLFLWLLFIGALKRFYHNMITK